MNKLIFLFLKVLTALEKKFADEKKQRTDFQLKLEAERKNKKASCVYTQLRKHLYKRSLLSLAQF